MFLQGREVPGTDTKARSDLKLTATRVPIKSFFEKNKMNKI